MFWLFIKAILRQNHYENIKVTLCHTSIQYGSECQYHTELAPSYFFDFYYGLAL